MAAILSRPKRVKLTPPEQYNNLLNLVLTHVWCLRPRCNVHSNQVIPTRFMMTSSNGNIFRVAGHLCGEFIGPGEFPAQRSVTRNFDVFLDLRLNKWLSKQSRRWWFETPSNSLWRHCDAMSSPIWCSHMSDVWDPGVAYIVIKLAPLDC